MFGIKRNRGIFFGIAAVLAGMMLMTSGCGKTADPAEAEAKTAAYEQESVTAPTVGSVGGEWTVMALARSAQDAPLDYYNGYLKKLQFYVEEKKGVLSENKYTEYSRVVLTLRSLGLDPSDVSGYDLQKPLEDFDAVTAQGLNGAVYALLALDSDGVDNGAAEQKYLAYILDQEKADGGFSLDEKAETADVDATSMVLQCLAPYQDNQEAADAASRGVEVLAGLQDKDGGFGSGDGSSSESVSQAVIALSSLGIDCNTDERFVKGKKGLYDTLMEFSRKEGGFAHTPDGNADPMATDQAFCALVAYNRMLEGENSFYNMTDAPKQDN